MSIERNVVFIHPLAMVLFELKEKLEESGQFVIYEMDDLREYTQTVGILEYSITFSTDLKKTSRYLQENKKFVRDPNSKNIAISSKKISPIAVNKLLKFGLDEILPEDATLKSLEYKIEMFFKAFERKIEQEQLAKQKTQTDFKVLNLNNQEEIKSDEKLRIERMSIGEEKSQGNDFVDAKTKQEQDMQNWLKQMENEEESKSNNNLRADKNNKISIDAWMKEQENEDFKLSEKNELGHKKLSSFIHNNESEETIKSNLKRKKGITIPEKEISLNFLLDKKTNTKKDPKKFTFEKKDKNETSDFIDEYEEKSAIDLNATFENQESTSPMLGIKINNESSKIINKDFKIEEELRSINEYEIDLEDPLKKKSKELEIRLDEERKGKELEIGLEGPFKKKSKELEIALDVPQEGRLLEIEIDKANRRKGKELEIKLDEIDFNEYELNLDEEELEQNEYEMQLEEIDNKTNNFIDRSNKIEFKNLEIAATNKLKKSKELELKIEKKENTELKLTTNEENNLKKLEKTFKNEYKEGLLKSNINKNQLSLDNKKRKKDLSLELHKKQHESKSLEIQDSLESELHNSLIIPSEIVSKKEDVGESFSLDKVKNEYPGEVYDKDKNENFVKDLKFDKVKQKDQLLDYSTFEKRKKTKGFRRKNLNKELTEEEKIEQLLEEPEVQYFSPNTFGLEFLALLQDLYIHTEILPVHIFKFLSFSLKKQFNSYMSVFVFDNSNRAHEVYNGHDGHLNFEEIVKNNYEHWKEISIPTWQDSTFQVQINEFIYPLYEDNIHIGYIVSHFENSVNNNEDAKSAETLIMGARGAAFSLYPFGGKI